jgi:hypothetical protein
MATTYRAVSSLSASGIADFSASTNTNTGTCSGTDIVNDTQSIGLASEIISLGEIAAGGAEYVEIVNLDEANFVSVGFANPVVAGTSTFRIKAGQSALFPTPSGSLYAIADTGAVQILKKAVEA